MKSGAWRRSGERAKDEGKRFLVVYLMSHNQRRIAMPKGKKKRITLEEAEKLYPNEWVVFCDVKIDETVTAFIDGVVYWHGTDQQEAYRKSAEIKGPAADFFMGSIPYKRVTLMVDNEVVEKAA
jgi:hypothetical protein